MKTNLSSTIQERYFTVVQQGFRVFTNIMIRVLFRLFVHLGLKAQKWYKAGSQRHKIRAPGLSGLVINECLRKTNTLEEGATINFM